jgi:hypothetical protein
MKKYTFLIAVLTLLIVSCVSQKAVKVVPITYDISDNLDLEAVASIFGESRNLEDFERKLNDSQLKISNLDLNEDGYVDYLRIVEIVERNTHVITIQAALGKDVFQDVATIDVEKNEYNKSRIQFIGHPYFYGPYYIIEPVYYRTPIIINNFWGSSYVVWSSPYYYNYYPSHYSYWRPIPVNTYVTHVHVYKNEKNTYKYVPERRSMTATSVVRDTRKDGYVSTKPNQSFATRNQDVKNKQELVVRRNTNNARTQSTTKPSATPRDADRTRDANSTARPRSTETNSKPRTSTTPSERKPSTTRPSNTTPSTRKPSTSPSTRTPSSTPTKRKNTKSERN